MDIVRVNEADRAIEVSESKDHVKNAPSFDDDEDITHEYEERIRSHFGLQSTETSSSRGSYGAYSGGDNEHEGGRGYQDQDRSSSTVNTEYGERAGTSSGATGAGGSTGDFGRSDSTGVQETSGTPTTRQTEETETFEEGGRTKVRRRIIREEIVEEDA
jgi:hypothetical protein